jgi:hypothetical protein
MTIRTFLIRKLGGYPPLPELAPLDKMLTGAILINEGWAELRQSGTTKYRPWVEWSEKSLDIIEYTHGHKSVTS